MALDRLQKREVVSDLAAIIASSDIVFVLRHQGLDARETADLRLRMRAANASYKVAKNSLARLAVGGTRHAVLASFCKGPTAFVFSRSPVAAAKATVEYAKVNPKIEVVAASFEHVKLDPHEVQKLAELPSLDVLRTRLAGQLARPAARLAAALGAPAGALARIVALAPGSSPNGALAITQPPGSGYRGTSDAVPERRSDPGVLGSSVIDAGSRLGSASAGPEAGGTSPRRDEWVAAWAGLRAGSGAGRAASVRAVADLVRSLQGTKVTDPIVAGMLRRASAEVRCALLDPNPEVSLAATIALFSGHEASGMPTSWSEEIRRGFVTRVEEYLRRNSVGLITSIQATRIPGNGSATNVLDVSVEVADTLSASIPGFRLHTGRPAWAKDPFDLKVYVAISGVNNEWSIVEDDVTVPERGLAARKLRIETDAPPDRLLLIDPVMNDHRLGRRSVRVGDVTEEPGYPLVT